MQFERVSKSSVQASSGRGKYAAIWAAVDALGDTGDAIAIKDMTLSDVQKFRSAARSGLGRNRKFSVSTRSIKGVLYVSRAGDAPPVVREFAAVR